MFGLQFVSLLVYYYVGRGGGFTLIVLKKTLTDMALPPSHSLIRFSTTTSSVSGDRGKAPHKLLRKKLLHVLSHLVSVS